MWRHEGWADTRKPLVKEAHRDQLTRAECIEVGYDAAIDAVVKWLEAQQCCEGPLVNCIDGWEAFKEAE